MTDRLEYQLYEGIVERPGWRSFLGQARAAFLADAASLSIEPIEAQYPQKLLFATDPLDSPRYGEIEQLVRGAPPVPAPVAARAAVALLRSHRRDAPAQAIDQSVGVTVALEGIAALSLQLWRCAGRTPFTEAERLRCEALAPALERTLRLFVPYAAAERERSIYRTVLDQIGVGVVVVDPCGAIMATNEVAARILEHGADLKSVQGILRGPEPEVTRALHAAIRDRADAQLLPRGASGKPIAIQRQDSVFPLTAVVFPGPNSPLVNAPLRRSAVVIMRDPARSTVVSAAIVAQLFALTPAEAALATEIAQGATLEEAAERIGVRRNTVRNQLQAIFAKTGTARQSELVRLINNSVAALSA